MRLLLDTHVWLWLVAEPEKIRPDVVEMTDCLGGGVMTRAEG